MAVSAPSAHRSRGWYSPRAIARSLAIRPRLYISAAAGLIALVLLPRSWSPNIRDAAAWDLSAIIYLFLTFRVMLSCRGDRIRARAARQDDGRVVILLIVLLAIVASFIAIGGLLAESKEGPRDVRVLHLCLAALTIVLAWAVTQVVFTLHYAHEYYRPSGGAAGLAQGLIFPQDANPDYWDFLYFSTSIGAASQTSDVAIRSKPLRRLVALHATIAFFFNTAVLALTINLAAGIVS
jgi:uncharacterized membrane protein